MGPCCYKHFKRRPSIFSFLCACSPDRSVLHSSPDVFHDVATACRLLTKFEEGDGKSRASIENYLALRSGTVDDRRNVKRYLFDAMAEKAKYFSDNRFLSETISLRSATQFKRNPRLSLFLIMHHFIAGSRYIPISKLQRVAEEAAGALLNGVRDDCYKCRWILRHILKNRRGIQHTMQGQVDRFLEQLRGATVINKAPNYSKGHGSIDDQEDLDQAILESCYLKSQARKLTRKTERGRIDKKISKISALIEDYESKAGRAPRTFN